MGNFKQGMLVQLPLHLDVLPGKPKAGDLHDALAAHYAKSNTPAKFVKVLPPTEAARSTRWRSTTPTSWRSACSRTKTIAMRW